MIAQTERTQMKTARRMRAQNKRERFESRLQIQSEKWADRLVQIDGSISTSNMNKK